MFTGIFAIAGLWGAFTVIVYGMIVYGSVVELWGVNNSLTFKHYVTAFSVRFEETGIRWTGAAWDSFWTTITIAAIAALVGDIILLPLLLRFLRPNADKSNISEVSHEK